MSIINLNFINRSNDENNSQVVIFQKNVTDDFAELAVAWKVIQNCGQGDNHPLSYPMEVSVSASDAWGNYTAPQLAPEGSAFQMVLTTSGDVMKPASNPASSPQEIEVQNNLEQGAISAYCYRDGSVCAMKRNLAPGQKAVFEFKPTIWVGVASQITQGQVMNSAIISNINTEISLLGIASADIVMTGGGPGASSTPFQFNLENIQYA